MKEKNYNQEDVDLIMQGIRPEGMDFDEFKVLRAKLKKALRQYLKGRMFHKSSWYEPISKTNYFYKKTSTYIKQKEDDS